MPERMRLGILLSGGGTTAEAVGRACQSGEIPGMDVRLVISNNKNAGGRARLRELGLSEPSNLFIDPDNFKLGDGTRDQVGFGEALRAEFESRGIQIVAQLGWLVRTPPNAVDGITAINQHPAPPEFGGKGMHGITAAAAVINFHRAVRTENPKTAVIAQYVDPEYDKGDVVKFEEIDVLQSDTPRMLQKRTLPVEHRVQIAALRDFARGELQVVRMPLYVSKEQRAQLYRAKQKARDDRAAGRL